MSQQQTVLRVLTNIPGQISGTTQYDFLDLYSDIPIKINKSISEIEDISKKNSDFSIGLNLPGSKKNNKFFESFFNVDSQSLYFNANQRVNCDVLLNDQSYFKGYLRLNKVSVLNSKVEYDVTLYSTVGELFGLIGNNLLKDLNYTDSSYTFNHTFNLNIASVFSTLSNFDLNRENPYPYFYPIVHNGYEYSGNTVNFSGSTSGSTRFYTSTSPISGFTSLTGATSAGAELYSINSPATSTNGGLVDNQLKPGLSIWNLIKLIFKTYGYTIKSDFFNTPWFKGLYMYGYFSSELTKFGYKITNIQQLPLEGVELIIDGDEVYVCKLDTGIPCYCSAEIVGYAYPLIGSPVRFVIPAGTYGVLLPPSTYTPYQELTQVPFADISTLKYVPQPVGTTKTYVDGDYVNFNLVIDQNIKQIDLLSSIAKKFDLVFIPDPDVPNQLIIEPYDYYIGTGEIHDWTPLLSFDKGFTVQPALNNIESNLVLTDLEDQDEGNRIFKNQNNRIYGQNNIYNITDFKSQEKKIDTIFSAELIRKWDKDGVDNINVPLGINYAASNNEAGNTNNSEVLWSYKGVKTKPKLIYWLGPFNPFNGTQGQAYNSTSLISSTYTIKMQASTGTSVGVYTTIPVISHTIPMGLSDEEKINNDSLCILFNSELPSNIGVQTFNTYTNNDIYNSFYGRRIGNLYNPNTRFVDGYFDLKYSDIQNLKWNDLIKVNEQYFTVNKIDGYNLTNRELTKVELIQYNTTPQIYPTRYFKYTYCDGSGCYKFKTNFTQKKLRDTNFSWSVWYDHNSGVLGGLNTGFVSTITYSVTGTTYYVPFLIEEITQTEYESVIDGCYDWTCDTLRNYAYTGNTTPFNTRIRSLWSNSTNNKQGLNLFTSCAQFNSIATGNSINVGSSTYFGFNLCTSTPTPTPTPTLTPTPTPTPTITITPTVTPTPGPDTCYAFNDWVLTTYEDTDGRFLVGGRFSTYSGITAYQKVAFTNTTGFTIDNTFDHTTVSVPGIHQAYGYFEAFSENSTGQYVVINNDGFGPGGSYTLNKLNNDGTVNGTFIQYTLREAYLTGLYTDKSNDKSWFCDTYDSTSHNTRVVLINNGGTILRDNVKASSIYDAKMLTNGSYLVSYQYSGSTFGLIKYNQDPSIGFVEDTTFKSNLGIYSGTSGPRTIVVDSNTNKFYVESDGAPINEWGSTGNITRFNSDGTIDSTFNFTGVVYSGSTFINQKLVSVNSDSKITFFGTNGTNVYLLRINSDGTLDNTFIPGETNLVASGASKWNVSSLSDDGLSFVLLPNLAITSITYKLVTSPTTRTRSRLIIINKDGTVRECP